MRTRLGLVLSLALAACGSGNSSGEPTSELATQPASGGASSASPTTAAIDAGAPRTSHSTGQALVIVPLHMHAEGPETGTHSADLHPDGTITMDDHLIARIDGARVLAPTGEVLLQLTSDGRLEAPGHGVGAELTENGEIVAPAARITVGADGSVQAQGANGQTSQAPFHFDPMPANARRTAAMIVALMLMPSETPTTESGSSAPPSATPEATADAGAAPASTGDAGHGHARRRH